MGNNEFTVDEETIICAFRYAVGKKNYIVSKVVRDLRRNAELFSQQMRQLMIKEIHDKAQFNALGHPNDREQWVALLDRLRELESEGQMV